MGLLSSLTKAVKTATSAVVTAVKDPISSFKTGAAAVTSVLSAPITSTKNITSSGIGAGLVTSINQAAQRSPTENITKSLATLGVVAGAVVGAGALAGSATAAKVISSVTPAAKTASTAVKNVIVNNPIKTAIAAPIIAGAVIQNPTKAADVAISAPSELFNLGQDASKVLAAPTKENIKELVTESPLLLGAGALLVAGKAGGGLIAASLLNDNDTNVSTTPQVIQLPKTESAKETNIIASKKPITPETAPLIATTGTTRRASKRKAVKPQNISQRVNLFISNRNTAKYINKRAF